MKNITCLIVLVSMFSCKENKLKNENQLIKNNEIKNESIMNNNDNIQYTTEDIKKYFTFNKNTNQYTINVNSLSKKFISNEISFPLKENDYDIKISQDIDYFDIHNFNLSNFKYRIIIYNSYGENDSKVLNIQLNSYDENNKLIDKLLLDSRFTFEIEYFRNFIINNDRTIEIKKFSIDKLLYNESGDIIGEKEDYDTVVDLVNYKIDNSGKFLKYKKE